MVSLDEISQMSVNSSSTTVMSLNKAADDYESSVMTSLEPVLTHTFQKMWKECAQQASQTNRISRRLAIYQQLLTKIPNWSTMVLEDTTKQINRDDIETLVQGLVMIKTKIQSILSSPDAKILMKVPTLQYVVHKCHIEVARILYKNVDVMDTFIPLQVQIEHRRKMSKIVLEGIRRAIASFVPTVALLRKQSKQIEERLKQEICVDEQEVIETKSIEMRSLATRSIGTVDVPAIREAPDVISHVNSPPKSIPEPQITETTILPPVIEPQVTETSLENLEPQVTEDIDTLQKKIETQDEPEEALKPKHTITVPTNNIGLTDGDDKELPLMINDMDEFDSESMTISFAIPVKPEENVQTMTESQFE